MTVPDPRVGTVLHGRYRIVERTNEGSMGVVYRGERVALRRAVAIKFLNEGYAATDDGRRRFEVEARAMSRLDHPNCVPVTDFGVDDEQPFLVMDFVTGCTLRQLLTREWRLPPARAVAIVRQILAGLAHAHAQQIIHRDIKPENILITPIEGHGEHARIVDFGLAKLRDEGSITTGVAVGTPGYMSPEQTSGEKADERADVYACGIILYELLSGAKPFQAESPFEVMRMHREDPPPPLDATAAGVSLSPRLTAVVMRALAKAREERFQSASELRAALEAVPEAHGRGGRGRAGARLAIAALGVAAFAAGGLWAHGRWGDRPPAAAVERAPARPDDPAEVAELRARATRGDVAGAIAGLEQLRDQGPDLAAVHYALGNLYAESQAWVPAVAAYAATVRADAVYRADPRLVSDVVEALGSGEAHDPAAELIAEQLGPAALPRLEQASRSTNPDLRARAGRLLAELRRAP
jgi:eukaryotic-like serine/threonine-protein kinase